MVGLPDEMLAECTKVFESVFYVDWLGRVVRATMLAETARVSRDEIHELICSWFRRGFEPSPWDDDILCVFVLPAWSKFSVCSVDPDVVRCIDFPIREVRMLRDAASNRVNSKKVCGAKSRTVQHSS